MVVGLYATLNPFSNYQYTYSAGTPPSTWTSNTYSPRAIAKRLSLTFFLSEVRAKTRGNQFIPFWGSWHMSIVIVQGFMLAMLCPLAFVALLAQVWSGWRRHPSHRMIVRFSAPLWLLTYASGLVVFV